MELVVLAQRLAPVPDRSPPGNELGLISQSGPNRDFAPPRSGESNPRRAFGADRARQYLDGGRWIRWEAECTAMCEKGD